MKKILLNIALLIGTASMSFAQFTFTPSSTNATGVTLNATGYQNGQATKNCDSIYIINPTVTNPGTFYGFQSYNGTTYSNATCTTQLLTGIGIGGGANSTIQVSGSVHFGLNMAAAYVIQPWNNACGVVSPSFGFSFPTACPSASNGYDPLSTAANPISVNLTSASVGASNQKLYINYIGFSTGNTGTLPTGMNLFRDPSSDAGAGAFGSGLANEPAVTFAMDGVAHQIIVDFSGTTVSNAAILAAVRQISFIYYNTAITMGYDLYILGFSIGTATAIAAPPVTAINNSASALVASTKLYPNPVSDQANIQLDLVTPSDVKVSLSDMMGREVMTIAQGSSISSVTQSFSVANLQKGIYTVNYFVNGAAAKSELLMVK